MNAEQEIFKEMLRAYALELSSESHLRRKTVVLQKHVRDMKLELGSVKNQLSVFSISNKLNSINSLNGTLKTSRFPVFEEFVRVRWRR